MSKKKFALLGNLFLADTILYIQKSLQRISKIDADFLLVDVKPINFDYCMTDMNELDGYMVFAPYRQQVMQYMDKISLSLIHI